MLKEAIRPIKRAIETALNITILKKLPRGLYFEHDISEITDPRIIFDVGANIGQSAARFARYFKDAEIHCFEPEAENFKVLRKSTAPYDKIMPHKLALGNKKGKVNLVHGEYSTTHHVIDSTNPNGSCELVDITSVDQFCASEFIPFIDILKIDTEGYDLEVIKGASALIESGNIGAIYTEAGMNPTNVKHTPYDDIKSFLQDLDYFPFGFYEQTREIFSGDEYLRRCNVAFIPKNKHNRKAIEDAL